MIGLHPAPGIAAIALCAKDGSDGRNERFAFIAGRFEVVDVVAYGDAEIDPCRDGVWDGYWFIHWC